MKVWATVTRKDMLKAVEISWRIHNLEPEIEKRDPADPLRVLYDACTAVADAHHTHYQVEAKDLDAVRKAEVPR